MRLFLSIVFIIFLLSGCTATGWKHWLETGETFQSWKHLCFSVKQTIKPARKPTEKEVDLSEKEKWFGDPVVYKK